MYLALAASVTTLLFGRSLNFDCQTLDLDIIKRTIIDRHGSGTLSMNIILSILTFVLL